MKRNEQFKYLGAESIPIQWQWQWQWGRIIEGVPVLQVHMSDRHSIDDQSLVKLTGTDWQRTNKNGSINLGHRERLQHIEMIKQGPNGYCFFDDDSYRPKKIFQRSSIKYHL
ncbi:hypothetical protein VIN01S_00750 [Vibrio inusitatus NBRC 102082]|uniref:Uncharacterized protein n=1 Tax=Vibrio inusitatus NBRC 102082 TaxID=1219070 RepID=A0A4Y3HQT9_9VIBR|nr:hypothetical protein [Vibrio inusitatus]GEA49271.1 hypothetical protein VIN01S_00750 [Vibrio inusitatus NBRC 102082]